jgi:hypothetical protein
MSIVRCCMKPGNPRATWGSVEAGRGVPEEWPQVWIWRIVLCSVLKAMYQDNFRRTVTLPPTTPSKLLYSGRRAKMLHKQCNFILLWSVSPRR